MKEMECIVKRRYGLKQSYQQMMEDFRNSFAQNYQNNVASTTPTPVPGEDFVDQLLNLNNEEDEEEFEPEIDFVVVKQEKSEEVIEDNQTPNSKKISPFLSPPNLDSVLSIPAEEADLEWLSQFVEESFSQFSNPYPAGFVKPKPKVLPEGVSFPPQSPSKSRRSKRARTGGRVWTTALSDPSSPSSPVVASSYKQQKKEAGQKVNGPGFGGGAGLSRRCSHCGVQKTPQWRAGPMGAKTLCNACGVRYKSGRLVPEYRPACSPTFSSELHSNSHRKILEMRKKKEIMVQPESGSLPHPVSSFG